MDNKIFRQDFQEHIFHILDQVTHGVVISDTSKENKIIHVNKAFTKLFGYQYDECIGKNCRFLQAEDTDQENLQLIREAIANKTSIQTVLRNYTKNGDLVYNEIKISPIFNQETGELQYFIGIQKDLLDRKIENITLAKHNESFSSKEYDLILQELNIYQTEILAQNDELVQRDRELATLNQEFASLFQDAPIAYIVIDHNLEVKRYNKLANEYFGFSNFKSIKSMFPIIKKGNREKLISWLLNKEYFSHNLEIDILCSNIDTVHRFDLHAKEYVIDPKYLLLSLNDIQESYEIKTMLEQKVEEKVAKVIEQERFILSQAKLASMGEMIDAIAHQWLNPLTTIKLYAQTCKMDLEQLKDKQLPYGKSIEKLEKIEVYSDHLNETLQEFRSFFRPDDSLEEVSINDIVKSCLLLMKDELLKSNIEVEIEEEENFTIRVIKNQFKHVFINLLTNSRDAFEENQIKERNIKFKYYTQDDLYIIEYSDTAGGIPQSVIEKIFEANFTTKEKGTGIGLYLSKQILDKFGIVISVENKEKGACFRIEYAKKLNHCVK